jgi:hypothetical protein
MKPRPGLIVGIIAGAAIAAGATWAIASLPMQTSGQLAVAPINVKPAAGSDVTPTPTPTPSQREKEHSGPATQVTPPTSHEVGDDNDKNKHGGDD